MVGQRHWLTIKKNFLFVKGLLILSVLGIIFWGLLLPHDVTIYTHEDFVTLNDGWRNIDSDNHAPVVIERMITPDMTGQCVLFYVEHQEVSAYVDDALIYDLSCPESLSIFGTAGRSWVSLPITSDMVGQTLRLSFDSAFAAFRNIPSRFYCVAENTIYAVQMEFLLVRNTVALLMLVLAVVSYTNAILWKQRRMKRFLFSLADLYLCIGLWLCAEVNVLAIWLGRGAISAILAMIFARMIPVMFYHFFMSILPYTSWRTRIAGCLVWANLLVSLVLQFVFGISLLNLLSVNLWILVAFCLLGLVEIGFYHGSGMQFLAYGNACYWVALLFLATLMECFIQLRYQTYCQWMGVPICLACVIYYIVTHIFLVSTQSNTAEEKIKLEYEFENLHKSPLNQQINAHFLYNSLNTISSYCKEDSAQAYEAIRLLGQYMRAYTKLVGANEYVDLEEELDLMQTYMALQNLRFENSIQFNVHNTCDDVMLPPLTLQPLVENAVNHGIRKREGGGTISITTCYKYNMAEIIVSDDGVGFDVKALKSNKSVGLSNLERRIGAMGGSLTVQSAQGKGTDVILMVPVQHTAWEEQQLDHFICG